MYALTLYRIRIAAPCKSGGKQFIFVRYRTKSKAALELAPEAPRGGGGGGGPQNCGVGVASARARFVFAAPFAAPLAARFFAFGEGARGAASSHDTLSEESAAKSPSMSMSPTSTSATLFLSCNASLSSGKIGMYVSTPSIETSSRLSCGISGIAP